MSRKLGVCLVFLLVGLLLMGEVGYAKTKNPYSSGNKKKLWADGYSCGSTNGDASTINKNTIIKNEKKADKKLEYAKYWHEGCWYGIKEGDAVTVPSGEQEVAYKRGWASYYIQDVGDKGKNPFDKSKNAKKYKSWNNGNSAAKAKATAGNKNNKDTTSGSVNGSNSGDKSADTTQGDTVKTISLDEAVKQAKNYTDSGKAATIKSKESGFKKAFAVAKEKGYTDAAVAGVIASGIVESGLDAGSVDGSAIGVFQVSGGVLDSLKKYSKNCGHKTGKNGVCSKWWCQLMWVVGSTDSNYDSRYYGKLQDGTYDKQRQKIIKGKYSAKPGAKKLTGEMLREGSKLVLTEKPDKWKYKKMTDAWSSALAFNCCWERSAGGQVLCNIGDCPNVDGIYKGVNGGYWACKEGVSRPALAEIIMQAYKGVDASDLTKDESTEVAETAAKTGVFSESEFVSWCAMTDIELDFADVMDLSASDNNTLQDWKDDLEKDKGDTWLIKSGRFLVMLCGIAFTVWMIFIYLFYWLDRVNNFVDIDFLPIATFNRLRVSDTEQECTFSVKDLAKGTQRTINHKHMIGVCLVGIAFGVTLISGYAFTVINALVTRALHFLGV